MFYVIFTFLNLINRSRTDMKQAFKIEMVVMIMLLLWEIDMILTA